MSHLCHEYATLVVHVQGRVVGQEFLTSDVHGPHAVQNLGDTLCLS